MHLIVIWARFFSSFLFFFLSHMITRAIVSSYNSRVNPLGFPRVWPEVALRERLAQVWIVCGRYIDTTHWSRFEGIRDWGGGGGGKGRGASESRRKRIEEFNIQSGVLDLSRKWFYILLRLSSFLVHLYFPRKNTDHCIPRIGTTCFSVLMMTL